MDLDVIGNNVFCHSGSADGAGWPALVGPGRRCCRPIDAGAGCDDCQPGWQPLSMRHL